MENKTETTRERRCSTSAGSTVQPHGPGKPRFGKQSPSLWPNPLPNNHSAKLPACATQRRVGILRDQRHSINKPVSLCSSQLKNPIKTLRWPFSKELTAVAPRIGYQETPWEGLQQNGDGCGTAALHLSDFSHRGGKGWPNSIERSERLLLGLPRSVTDSETNNVSGLKSAFRK